MSNSAQSEDADAIEEFVAALTYKARWLQLTHEEIEHFTSQSRLNKQWWDEIQVLISEQNRARDFARSREYFEHMVRGKLISDFVDAHVQANGKSDNRTIKLNIEIYAKDDRTEELQAYLHEVLELGYEKARKKRKREKWSGGYAGYAWELLNGIIRVGIVIGVFSVVESRFQTIVFALLILIYNSLETGFSVHGLTSWRVAVALDGQFKRVRRLLKEKLSGAERETSVEDERGTSKELGRTTVRFYIHGLFLFVTWVIALWKVAVAIL